MATTVSGHALLGLLGIIGSHSMLVRHSSPSTPFLSVDRSEGVCHIWCIASARRILSDECPAWFIV